MASFDVLSLVTDVAKRKLLLSLGRSMTTASGCIGVTHFSVGNQGHDPVDPFNALTPDVTMVAPIDEIISPPLRITDIIIDQSSELFPTFQIIIPPGLATGEFSSLYLWGTVYNDPEVEAELNAGEFTAISPPPYPYTYLIFDSGVPRYQDLPSPIPSLFGHARNVADEDVDYYCNGTTWKPIHEKFLFSITNMPRTIKFESETDEFRLTLQM